MGHLRTVEEIVDIKHLVTEGLNASQIARRLGMHRTTVAKSLQLRQVHGRYSARP